MKKTITAILLLVTLVTGQAYAACDLSNTSGLPEAKVKELELACQTALDEVKGVVVPGVTNLADPGKLSEWGVVAQEWAKALGIAARELGIAADEFLGTTAGKLTAAVIIYQVAGEDIMGIVLGVPLLIVVLVVGSKLAHKCLVEEVVFSETEKNWRGKPLIKKVVLKNISECGEFWLVWCVTLICSVCLAILIIPG